MANDGKTVLAASVPAAVDRKFLRFMVWPGYGDPNARLS
jgi:hypothetical protein